MADPLDWLRQLLGGKAEDWEPPVPPPLPPQDVLYQDASRGSMAQHGRRDMEIVATPRLPSENIDELIRSGNPGTADSRMLYGRSDLGNAQFNFAPGYLRKAGFDGRPPQTADVGTGIPLNLDRTPVPDTGQGTAWSHLQQAPGDILQSVLGLLERGQLGGLNALGLRSPGSDIYRAQIPVEPGLRAAEGAATLATGGLASSLFPAAGALKAGAQYAVPPGTMPGLLADEMGGTHRAYKGMLPYDWQKAPVYNGRGEVVRPGVYENVTEFKSTRGPFAGFFSDDPAVASRFAQIYNGAVYPVNATLDNPQIIDAAGKPAGAFQFGDMAREHNTLDEMKQFIRALYDPKSPYDGAILKNTKDEGTIYVPRLSSQVKSIFED